MTYWLDSWPALRVMEKEIPADVYNTIRVGLLRHSLPWTLPLVGIPCQNAVLDDRAWVCVDACHNDMPILAWTDFHTVGRDSLDASVRCKLKLYHIHAGLLMGRALEALGATMRDRLRSYHTEGENHATG